MNSVMTRIAAILSMGVMMIGAKCTSTPSIIKPETPVATVVYDDVKKVTESNEVVKANAEEIQQSATAITQSAIAIKDKTEDPVVAEEASKIVIESNKVENASISIQKEVDIVQKDLSAENIQPLLEQIEQLENTNSDWKKKYDDLVAASTAEIQKIVRIFWMVGFAMIVAGMIVAYFHKVIGGIILCAGFVSVGLAAANQYYYQEIATVGLVVFIIGFLASAISVGYFIFRNKKTEEAVADNVKLLEDIKTEIPEEAKVKIFGDGGLATKVQKQSTQRLVKEIRSKLVK
jgi:uncharacterized membrane protein YciS (DUF1049 family)